VIPVVVKLVVRILGTQIIKSWLLIICSWHCIQNWATNSAETVKTDKDGHHLIQWVCLVE